jgi:NodT family efflux transporter outer membrane factor (OMF) lipoprotein
MISGATDDEPGPCGPASPRRAPAVLASLFGLLAASCVAGPNFKPPAAPDVAAYTDHPLAATAAAPGVQDGQAQRFVSGADIPGDWWTLFHSSEMNQLITLALANNHDLKAAQAALAAAKETVLAQKGAYYPSVGAGLSATRQRQSGALAPTPISNAFTYSLFTPEVAVTYTPDVFGLNRRTVESVQAQAQAARYQMVAAHLTLTSNVALAAIQCAALQTQIDATRQLIDINSKIIGTLKYQSSKGYVGGLDVAAHQAQLAQVTATLPPLEKQLAQEHDLLAALTGRYPGQAAIPALELSNLTLPADLPVSLPSKLVAQRPDVLQAEANLHAASAQVGIAAANRLPNVQLTAGIGSTALALGGVFGPQSGFWSLGAALTQPIFDGGQLKHQEAAAKAAYVESVLNAFQNVADSLTAIEQDAKALKSAADAEQAAQVTLDLSQRQWRAGYAGYLSVLNAEQAYQNARITLVQAQASRFSDTAALFQALGGGWWGRADLAGNAHAS